MRKSWMKRLYILMVLAMISGCVEPEPNASDKGVAEDLAQTQDQQTTAEVATNETEVMDDEPNQPMEADTWEESSSQVSEGYYADTFGLTGEALKATLNDIITDGHGALSYDQVYSALEDTDEDPGDPSKVLLFYKNVGVPDNYKRTSDDGDIWNREHVWAKSHGDFGTARGPGTDLHMIRPTDASVNARRGHLDFDYSDNVFQEAPDTYVDKDSFEPRDAVKGDVARMLFYMAVRYEGEEGEVDLELADRTDTYYSNRDKYGEHGKLSTLLEWHILDPVDDLERFRNERIHEVQGNRNPFIDHPDFVGMIWGDSDVTEDKAKPEDREKDHESSVDRMSIEAVRSTSDNVKVNLFGTVVYVENQTTLYVQDGSGGIRIDSYGSQVDLSVYQEGQQLSIEGITDTYKGEKEVIIESEEDIHLEAVGSGFEPTMISLIDLSDGMSQGELILVESVEVTSVSRITLVVEDQDGYRMTVYLGSAKDVNSGDVRVGQTYDIYGIAAWYEDPQIKLISGQGLIRK